MRIFEITDRNKIWKGMSGTNIDYNKDYQHILNAYKIITGLKRINSYPVIISQIDDFIKDSLKFLNANFPDAADPDIVHEKETVQQMVDHLRTLKSTLQ